MSRSARDSLTSPVPVPLADSPYAEPPGTRQETDRAGTKDLQLLCDFHLHLLPPTIVSEGRHAVHALIPRGRLLLSLDGFRFGQGSASCGTTLHLNGKW